MTDKEKDEKLKQLFEEAMREKNPYITDICWGPVECDWEKNEAKRVKPIVIPEVKTWKVDWDQKLLALVKKIFKKKEDV